ncbi:MAG: Tad domain-containing protein [Methylococcaceae bacterium]|nr:Tad domain-containing protein [Methylococcaceae bacterium]
MNLNKWMALCFGLRRGAAAQSGAILPLVAIGMLALLAMAGLALDMGHAYLNKTRLQNALDAAALSGAKTLDESSDTAKATTAALTAFTMNANAAGNAELQDIAIGNVLVEFSDTLNPFVPGGANPRFVRAGVAATDFARPSWLIQVIGFANVPVGARAVAGPSPALTCPEILPVAPCGTPGAANYGYTLGQEVVMKTGKGTNGWELGPGNYQNVDLGCDQGGGGACIRDNMAGAYQGCTSPDDTIQTKPGSSVGPNAQGLNTRFGCPPPGCGGVDTSTYKPDVVTDAGGSGYPDTYDQYKADRSTPSWDIQPPTAQLDPPRRLASVPVIDCSTTVNGSGPVKVLGLACMFLTRPAEHNGSQEVYGEFRETCLGLGSAPGPNPVIGPGPHTIILYKDFGAADS